MCGNDRAMDAIANATHSVAIVSPAKSLRARVRELTLLPYAQHWHVSTCGKDGALSETKKKA